MNFSGTNYFPLSTSRLVILLLLIQTLCSGQNSHDANWVLGNPTTPEISGTLINFSPGNIELTPFQKEFRLVGSIAAMSDENGEFLFYSNGCVVIDRNHELLMNGDSLGMGILETSFCDNSGNPLVQGIIALPAPNDPEHYYLFYTDLTDPYSGSDVFFPLAPTALYYSRLSRSANGGLGAVIEKNQVILTDTLSRGQIQACRHNNGQDWWIVMPKSHSDCYHTVLLTDNGIDTFFVQCLGDYWGDRDASGQAVFSPNGGRYARFNFFYGLRIFEFDNETGIFTNPVNIPFPPLDTFYRAGVAFSPNSQLLYATSFSEVYQFDLNSGDIANSKTLIAELQTPDTISLRTSFNQTKLAPDGKIYIAGSNTHKYLHVIHNPNCRGVNANLEQYALAMPANNTNGLPNFPHYRSWNEADTCDFSVNTLDNIKSKKLIRISPNPAQETVRIERLTEPGRTLKFILYDLTGRPLAKRRLDNLVTEIDLSLLPQGFYIYVIRDVSGLVLQTGRIVRQ